MTRMFPAKKTKQVKASTDTSAAAAKMKHKILNTSSFLKASLQTNNRALARALQAQRERRGQLEKEVVYLQKQVEVLCFELATRKYKEKKLLLHLKVLHSDTLERLGEAAELLSDLECPEQSEDQRSRPADVTRRSFRLRDPVRSEFPVLNANQACRRKAVVAVAATAATAATSGHATQSVCDDGGEESDPPTSSRSSVSLREGEGPTATRGPDVNDPNLQEAPSRPPAAEPRPPRAGWQEKTLLLNTTMEMTVCNATEIVTVETGGSKTSWSRKAKGKKVKKRGGGGAETQDASSPPEDTRTPALPERPPPDTRLNRPVPSRIPKLGGHQDRVRPPDPPGWRDATQPQGDWFSDSGVNRLAFVSCRRSRVKKTSSVTRDTVFTPSADHAEGSQTTPSAQPPPEGDQLSEERRPESGPAPHVPPGSGSPETGCRAVNYSRGGNKSRCRSTFFLVGGGADQASDPTPPAGSAPDPPGLPNDGKSWKRPRTAAQEVRGGDGLDAPPPDHQSTAGPHKRARTEEEAGTWKLRETFVVYRETSPDRGRRSSTGGVGSPDAAVQGRPGDLLVDELPPWLGVDISFGDTETETTGVLDSSAASAEAERRTAVQPLPGTAPPGRVLTSLTNSASASGDGEASGRSRRRHHQVSYREPPLNRKMRREEPSLKEDRKKKKKKKTSAAAGKDESSGRPVKD